MVVDLDFIHAGVYAEVYLQGANLFSRFFFFHFFLLVIFYYVS